MFKVLLPAAAALGLVVFSAQSQGAVSNPVALQPAPIMGWSVHNEGALAKLAYGVANSDQLALMVSCQPGDATASVYGDVQPETTGLIQDNLTSQTMDPLSGGEAEVTRIALNDPTLRGLATGGRMTVRGDAGLFQLAASTEERRMVGRFLAYCSAGRA